MSAALCLATLVAIISLVHGAPTLPAGLVRTPSGVFPAECVHSIPSGATMERDAATDRLHVHLADGTLHAILPKCENGVRSSLPSNYDGWEACATPRFAQIIPSRAHKPFYSYTTILRFISSLPPHLQHVTILTFSFQIHCIQRPAKQDF
jgi:hypothetical protein